MGLHNSMHLICHADLLALSNKPRWRLSPGVLLVTGKTSGRGRLRVHVDVISPAR